ncbi:MAG TPA: hypothetical protein VGD45_19575 [Steroidobacter sp.]|uniref:hypothetical protein n=1 Tax=Steroidobacter sp. TaxID=1978227 RepID=UPI002ED92C6D
MKVFTIALAAALCCANAAAAPPPIAGTITQLRVHSANNTESTARGTMILQLSTAATNGCVWLFIKSDDKNTLSTALSAKLADRAVTVYYDNTVLPAWGDPTTCAVTAIEISG